MSHQILHFRDANVIVQQKNLSKHLDETFKAIETDVGDSTYKGTALKTCLDQYGWREGQDLSILPGRRYAYKGLMKRIAIEANLINYEWILDGLFRLQLGFDRGLIDTGLLLLNSQRSEKSPLGDPFDLVVEDVEKVYPTISMPLSVVLFNFEGRRFEDQPPKGEHHDES
jgi:hypothetical protein